MLPSVGPLEMIIVLAIALMIFGPKKLPEMGRSVGKGLREFKNSVSGDDGYDLTGEEGFDAPVLDQKPTVAAAATATAPPVTAKAAASK